MPSPTDLKEAVKQAKSGDFTVLQSFLDGTSPELMANGLIRSTILRYSKMRETMKSTRENN